MPCFLVLDNVVVVLVHGTESCNQDFMFKQRSANDGVDGDDAEEEG